MQRQEKCSVQRAREWDAQRAREREGWRPEGRVAHRTKQRLVSWSLCCALAAAGGLLLATGATGMPAAKAEPSSAQAIPDWFLRGIEEKTRDGGLWIADNSPYSEEDGGIEAYGIEWRQGIGGKSMAGRLFSLRGGEELATHWEFRLFWHPVEQEAKAYQFGVDGTVGWGVQTPAADGHSMIIDQTFASPDGTTFRARHETHAEDGKDIGQSFTWVDGHWQPSRSYTWILQR